MVQLGIRSQQDNLETLRLLIQGAIDREIEQLRLSLKKSDRYLQEFEEKYRVSSQIFLENWSAEDLEGGDEEYITWMGEIKVRSQILQSLQQLEQLEYVIEVIE
jgi:hypothetical protein